MKLTRRHVALLAFATTVFIFGQNFDFVPENKLMRPMRDRYLEPASEALQSRAFIQRNVMRGPASLAFDSSDTFEKMAKKTLQAGAQNLASSEEFRNSEVGRFIKELEKKAQAKVKLWAKWMRGSSQSSESENQNRGPEVALIASPAYAGLKLKSTEMETSCGYSVQNKSMDLLIGSPSSSGSFGMGYTPQDQSSTVKMQWNW